MSVADPHTIRAIVAAREARAAATGKWVSEDEDDPAAEAEQLARDALAHLEGDRWDEAIACAQEVAELAEEAREGALWREFTLLVEEAAEIGRGAQADADDDADDELDHDGRDER